MIYCNIYIFNLFAIFYPAIFAPLEARKPLPTCSLMAQWAQTAFAAPGEAQPTGQGAYQ